ncbi:S-layer homology domain-containing protein [Paenibacillus sp. DMB20]|uniref:S-layer homology domain-containing protein n=1 Tax=Paenibacillus sp. DMB20 TaxID=1642570 RepID=UPI00069A5583|nr:S-layer homology domain-containing protein [Paenibacillus sp. DMB20]
MNVTGYTTESTAALHKAIQEAKTLGNGAPEQDLVKAYSKVMNALDALQPEGKYQYESNPKMTAAFGFEGDKNASLAFLDGSYQIGGSRPEQHGPVAPKQMVTFGVANADGIKWYNAEGYLPAFIHEYSKDNMDYKIESFANKHSVEGKDYVIDYSRMTVTNHSGETRLLPIVSKNLIPLNAAANQAYTIEPGETIIRDYAIEADKYEYFDKEKTSFTSLTREQVASQGNFDDNYNGMKSYWDDRLSAVVDLDLPNKELVNAFKAGYIYTMLIKDANYLHIGENGYARLYSHDTIGILVQLIQSGDFAHAKDYLKSVPLTGGINIETGEVDGNLYWDANWKLPWAYAVYLSKTGDTSIFKEAMKADDGTVGTVFEKRIKYGARSIEKDRTGDGRIMKETYAIDSPGYWTIDNYAALAGLASYEYITRELYKVEGDASYLEEAEWAKAQYEDLLAAFTAKLQATIMDKGLNYIPASVVQSNDENRMKDSRDANWASMFLFGRWLWDGYLYGANQPEDNINLKMLDDTYSYGIERRVNEGTTDSPFNFGGYPHGFYSSSYNAGYGSAALRGEQYRDMGIKAYEFMIEKSMSGPFSWWEGVDYPRESSPWKPTNEKLGIQNTPGGGGSAQHIWGQSVNSKVLVDSLIAERIYDQNTKYEIIIGRGIPKEWVANADKNNNVVAAIRNYPAFQGGRVGYDIVRQANRLVVTFAADVDQAKADLSHAQFSIQLPSMVNNISEASAGVVDNAKGIVTVPLGTQSVTITLSDLPKPADVELDKEDLEIGFAAGDSSSSVTKNVTLPTEGKRGSAITWSSSEPNVISNTGKVKRPSASTQVTLTATLEKDGLKAQKTFILTVIKADADPGSPGNGGGDGNSGNNGNNGNSGNSGNNSNNGNNGNSGSNGNNNNNNNGNNNGNSGSNNGSNGNNGNSGNHPKFKDITNHWALESIMNAVEREIVKGYADGTFRPNNVVKRSELMVMLGRALKLPQEDAALSFADAFKIPAWAKSYIAGAVKSEIVKGYKDNTFRPDGKVTRIEFVAMVARALDLKGGTKALPFADADQIPAWGIDYAAAAYEAGLIQGKGNNKFAPNDPVTRAEAVTVLMKVIK